MVVVGDGRTSLLSKSDGEERADSEEGGLHGDGGEGCGVMWCGVVGNVVMRVQRC